MSSRPQRRDSLADVVEMLLDKGVVINADIVVTVGETELLGIKLRAAIASFETAAQYGLEFPDGTDMERVEEITGRSRPLETVDASSVEDEEAEREKLIVTAPVDDSAETESEDESRGRGSDDGADGDGEADDEAAGDDGSDGGTDGGDADGGAGSDGGETDGDEDGGEGSDDDA
uniref:gas vesicle protein GvpJ n=1 Tax=Halegenticoccus tardaugens TaxID=2071624 RepID=UPI00374477A9